MFLADLETLNLYLSLFDDFLSLFLTLNFFLSIVKVGLRLLYRTGFKEAVWSAMNLIIIYGWLEEIMERVGQLT